MDELDELYYQDEFGGECVDTSDFYRLRSRAKSKIDSLIHYQVTDISKLDAFRKKMYFNAICAQMEYSSLLGASGSAGVSNVTTASVGNFSYTDGRVATSQARLGLHGVAPEVMDYLSNSGFLFSGVDTHE